MTVHVWRLVVKKGPVNKEQWQMSILGLGLIEEPYEIKLVITSSGLYTLVMQETATVCVL